MEDESKCVVFTEKQDKDTQQIFHVLPCVLNTMDPGRNENSALIELADFFSDMLMF